MKGMERPRQIRAKVIPISPHLRMKARRTVCRQEHVFPYDTNQVDEEMQGVNYTAIYSSAAQKQGSAVYWMLLDGQGSTRQLLVVSQVTQASYITDAYGNSVSSTGTATNPLKWNGGSGYYSDGESGLQKVGARYYEPATGVNAS